ncbi:MAG: hypothetical protein GY756_00900 [bacterium]|nr:hypothetical protein [bacterium]
MNILFKDINVMYVRSECGPAGARKSFNKLESYFPTIKGRKFYGTFMHGEYKACVAIQPKDNPEKIGLPVCIIPGGLYAREKIIEWNNKTKSIVSIFDNMAKENEVDLCRPSIEFYRSFNELHLLLPVK